MRHILNLIDDATCVETVRQLRWSAGVVCPHGGSPQVTKQGRDETPSARQRYQGQACQTQVDDLTGPIFAGHHQPWRAWILCLDFMGLNLSNEPIAQALDGPPTDVQSMASQLRAGIMPRQPDVTRTGAVECDEVDVVAGHQGHPAAVNKKAVPPDAAG